MYTRVWEEYLHIHHLGMGGVPAYTPPGYREVYTTWYIHHLYTPGYTIVHCLYLYRCTPSRAVSGNEALGSERENPLGGREEESLRTLNV